MTTQKNEAYVDKKTIRCCTKCVMLDTRPGIMFNSEGACAACSNYEKRKLINWDERRNELEQLCDNYRDINGTGYNCAIAVSGGKDSHYQVHIKKEIMGMNPILFLLKITTQ